MNITVLTFGTRGDVEPFLALALGLQRAGHAVKLVAPPGYSDWIQSYGVEAYPMRFEFNPLQANTHGKSGKPFQRLRGMRDELRRMTCDSLEDYEQASHDADLLIQSVFVYGGTEIAARRGIALIFAHPYPFTPTREFPSFGFALRGSLGGAYNRWTQLVVLRLNWWLWGSAVNLWRVKYFGLLPWRSHRKMMDFHRSLGAPNLVVNSPNVLSKPADWDSTHEITGHWFLDPPQDWQPPEDLLEFLENGPPPVYVGFGSMAHGDPVQRTQEVLRALEISGQRGVILSGGGGALARLPAPATVFYIDDVPHAWLFPRMAALVHHGGGSVFTGLRAGIPSIIAPLAFDQHAWAELVQRLGVGIRLPHLKKLKAEKLAAAISTAIRDVSIRDHAATLGQKIRSEDGVAHAVEIIECHAAKFRERRRQADTTQ